MKYEYYTSSLELASLCSTRLIYEYTTTSCTKNNHKHTSHDLQHVNVYD